MITLDSQVKDLNRVGVSAAKKLERLEVRTVRDLLMYFPYRYEDYSQATPLSELRPGMTANVSGTITAIQTKRSPRRRMYVTEALIADGRGELRVVWFNQPYLGKTLHEGDRVSLAGKAEADFAGVHMVSPVYEKLGRGGAIHTQGVVPVYSLTAGLTGKQVRFLVDQVIQLAARLDDWVPPEIISRLQLPTLDRAVAMIHFPARLSDAEQARQRLAFDEIFLLELVSLLAKEETAAVRTRPVAFDLDATKRFVDGLPFRLTDSQRRSSWEIIQDMDRDRSMARLLIGDVGSGKTIVALLAALNTVRAGRQAAIMAPTEILAAQHYATFEKFLANEDIKIALITGSEKKHNFEISEKLSTLREARKALHDADILIGTHALIQEDIAFRDLALAVVDEQHRFGVDQRQALIARSGGLPPHLLTMTATPIPRSLALLLYGDLDVSVISELPAGRKPIITRVVPEHKRADAYDFVRQEIGRGRQAYVICPLIDPSDKLGVKSVTAEYDKLSREVFPDLAIGLLHGRLKPKEKQAVMADFQSGRIQILVSTSVVEVGVDVRNATIMLIEGADRFGLAQLHQFRGRVGRGEHQSYCLLASDSDATRTIERLNALVKCHDGFTLAKTDLKYRGPGEIFGTAQSGFPEFKFASLFDYALIKSARAEAEAIIKTSRDLKKFPKIREKIASKWEKRLD